MSAGCCGVPDLLRRFVAMPHETRVTVGDIEIAAQSNDAEIIAALQRAGASGRTEVSNSTVRVSIVRDEAAPCDVSEIRVISAAPLETLLAGTGTFLTVDRERREILGFLAAGIPARTFADELLPRMLALLCGSRASAALRLGGDS